MLISLIAAASTNRAIGKDGGLPWHLPADLRFFKEKTMGHHMLMGRKTWEAFPKALPGRTSIVLGKFTEVLPEGVLMASSLAEGIDLARNRGEEELMIIGGGQLYESSIALADRIYLTHVLTKVSDAAAFFPLVSALEWEIISSEYRDRDEKNPFPMEFMELRRKGV